VLLREGGTGQQGKAKMRTPKIVKKEKKGRKASIPGLIKGKSCLLETWKQSNNKEE